MLHYLKSTFEVLENIVFITSKNPWKTELSHFGQFVIY